MTRLCPECAQPLNGMCESCGIFYDEPELIVTDLYNYKAKPQRCYKREDHFKEVLYQLQGKEGKDVPKEILETVTNHLPDPLSTNVTEIRAVLRKLKLTKYVENVFYITFAITGQEPPFIPRESEDKMIRLFSRILVAYGNIENHKRRSFPNYYYIVYKLLELMGHTDLLVRVPMLKTKLRVKHHDQIWKQLCGELDWTFIPTQAKF